MILPKIRDKRFITIRRGGTLTDDDHRLLALWAADCAGHVLHLFADARPQDDRPRRAIEAARAWANGEIKMTQAKEAAGASQDAARDGKGVSEAARLAALSAGQAAVVTHVAAHELGAAAYAIRSAMEAAVKAEREAARIAERDWQRSWLPDQIRDLVLDDERLRDDICWFVFGDGRTQS
jgi:glycogen debranching enzyme